MQWRRRGCTRGAGIPVQGNGRPPDSILNSKQIWHGAGLQTRLKGESVLRRVDLDWSLEVRNPSLRRSPVPSAFRF